jgi:integrase
MIAMLIGCGLRHAELLSLTLKSIQRREERRVIADPVGKGRTYARCPSRPG